MSTIRTTFLLSLLAVLFVIIGSALGGRLGMIIALLFSMVMIWGSYWHSDKLVLRMYHAKEVSQAQAPELYAMVGRLAERAKMPIPRVYIIESSMPNAFATGRNPSHAAVAVTTGITRILDRDELEGVLAHEMTHIKNRDTLTSAIAATIAGAVTALAYFAQFSLLFGGMGGDDDGGGNIVGILLMAVLAPIAATIVQLAISRTREFEADAGGADLCSKPMALASALSKLDRAAKSSRADVNPATAHMFIVNPLRGRMLASLFSTHPSAEERIKRLTAMQ
ncbi:MAG: zinc metalloprotease HtpX [Euryarchaeota archaeon]|nr:zinc metalloprotease HtpX [Euryarchaeota archaeon]